ncbi:MAG: ion transporter [Cyclobacteriaceae bacterium]|nr:MAG: ion transporter [Cyclobacteriaceae bacterium]
MSKNHISLVKDRLHRIIFGVDTPAGQAFDMVLLFMILSGVAVLMLESVDSIRQQWGMTLYLAEWAITLLFTIEYLLRVWVVKDKARYILSFYGIIDLFSVLPTYLSMVFAGSHMLAVIRVLRLLRIFRVLKLVQFMGEANKLKMALRHSSRKIVVFIYFVLIISIFVGSLMFVIEGKENGFTSIPRSVYWAIVTLTTVGYGDIVPQTSIGQILATLLMITGYGVIAVPTGLVTAELVRSSASGNTPVACRHCNHHNPIHANYCMQCGRPIDMQTVSEETNNPD